MSENMPEQHTRTTSKHPQGHRPITKAKSRDTLPEIPEASRVASKRWVMPEGTRAENPVQQSVRPVQPARNTKQQRSSQSRAPQRKASPRQAAKAVHDARAYDRNARAERYREMARSRRQPAEQEWDSAVRAGGADRYLVQARASRRRSEDRSRFFGGIIEGIRSPLLVTRPPALVHLYVPIVVAAVLALLVVILFATGTAQFGTAVVIR